MKWIRERDALIAQTLAFVQSVSGRRDDVRSPSAGMAAPVLTAEIVSVQAVTVAFEPPQTDPLPQAAVPLQPSPQPSPQPLPQSLPQPFPVPPPRPGSDFRSEMQARIASFRKHQQRFEREREEYCAATLTKLRAAIRDGGQPPSAPK
jgi:hypothetical protein